jgi:hypothetical protein
MGCARMDRARCICVMRVKGWEEHLAGVSAARASHVMSTTSGLAIWL